MSIPAKLGKLEHAVLMTLINAGINKDVYISTLWTAMYGDDNCDMNARERQQYVGGCISRINRKLKGQAIVPGELKHTYRITEVKLTSPVAS